MELVQWIVIVKLYWDEFKDLDCKYTPEVLHLWAKEYKKKKEKEWGHIYKLYQIVFNKLKKSKYIYGEYFSVCLL